MNLPFFKKKLLGNIYFALFLKEEEGIGFILENFKDKVEIIVKEKFTYSVGWENLVEDVDDLLFRLENRTKKHVKKTIFFIYSHLIEEKTKEIKPPYLSKIKNLAKNLELEPIGYIECYEAIIAYLENKEQLPLTSILIELDTSNLSLFIYKGGHKVFQRSTTRTNNIIDDFLNILKECKEKIVLPSRIILYNSANLSSVSTQIVSYRWNQDFFIQIPRVEIVNEENQYVSLIELFQKQITKTIKPETQIKEEKNKEIMGFVIGRDIEKKPENKVQNKIDSKPNIFNKVNVFFAKMLSRFKINSFAGIGLGAFLIITSFFLIEFFLHKATITILFSPYLVNKEIDYSPDLTTATISATLEKSKAATGNKQIGNNAHGEVTIYSYDDKEKTFSKGMTIEAKNVKFSLDENIKIASSSLTSDGSAKLPGKGKIKITAVVIGPEGNLTKDERFKIDDLSISSYFAVNEEAFSGGTSKEIKTVSKVDIDSLKETILNEGKKELRKKINSTVSKENNIVDQLSEYWLTEVDSSKEIGEEADKIKLQAQVQGKIFSYKTSGLIKQLEEKKSLQIPEGFSIHPEYVQSKVDKVVKKNENVFFKMKVNIKAVKNVNEDELLKKFTGKSKATVTTMIKNDLRANGFEMSIKPSFFLFDQRLPFLLKNINLKISSL